MEFVLLERLFNAAMEQPPGKRDEWLQRECAADVRRLRLLRQMVEHAESDTLRPDIRFPTGSNDVLEPPDRAGERIGDFQLERRLHFGGMADVYLGRRIDHEFEQLAAVKLVRSDRISDELIAHFVDERRVLASLRHPNICQLIDGGRTADGEAYFVMEYIDGQAFTRHEGRDDHRDLGYMLDLCGAVRHAHEQLILHCDIKPSNVLIDERGTLKLLDFGISRLLEDDAGGPGEGFRAAWRTSGYSAPEMRDGRRLTPATDVYALGVLLRDLLESRRGDRPFAGWMARDLALIAERASRAEMGERYSSVAEFADDLERVAGKRPISLRGRNPAHRALRFVQRHAVASVLTGALLATATAMFVREVELRRVAEAARHDAELQLARANEVSGFMIDLFAAADVNQNRGQPVAAEALLDQAFAELQTRSDLDPATRAEFLKSIGMAYASADYDIKAVEVLRAALGLLRDHPELDELQRADLEAVAGNMIHRGETLGPNSEAIDLLEEALPVFERRLPPEDFRRIKLYNALGSALANAREFDRARAYLQRALDASVPLREAQPIFVAAVHANLARLERFSGQPERALEQINRALRIKESTYGTDESGYARTLITRSQIHRDLGDWERVGEDLNQALAIYERNLEPEHASIEITLGELANLYHDLGQYERAEQTYLRQIAHPWNVDNPRSRSIAINNLAFLYADRGEDARALPLFIESLAIRESLYGPRDNAVGSAAHNLGDLYRRLDQPDEARPLLSRALDIRSDALGPDHPRTVSTRLKLAWLEASHGDRSGAQRALSEVEMRLTELGSDDADNWSVLFQVRSELALAGNDRAGSARELRRALEWQVRRYGGDHPRSLEMARRAAELER